MAAKGQVTADCHTQYRKPDLAAEHARAAGHPVTDAAAALRGHAITIRAYGWRAEIGCTCGCALIAGVRLRASDAVAAWRQHLYDEGVLHEQEEEAARLPGSGGGSGDIGWLAGEAGSRRLQGRQ
jgi:hypothetical protein